MIKKEEEEEVDVENEKEEAANEKCRSHYPILRACMSGYECVCACVQWMWSAEWVWKRIYADGLLRLCVYIQGKHTVCVFLVCIRWRKKNIIFLFLSFFSFRVTQLIFRGCMFYVRVHFSTSLSLSLSLELTCCFHLTFFPSPVIDHFRSSYFVTRKFDHTFRKQFAFESNFKMISDIDKDLVAP